MHSDDLKLQMLVTIPVNVVPVSVVPPPSETSSTFLFDQLVEKYNGIDMADQKR